MSSPAEEKPSERESRSGTRALPRILRASEAPPTARRRALVTGHPPRPGAPPLNIVWGRQEKRREGGGRGSRRRRSRSRGGGRGRERRGVETWFRIDGLRLLFAKGRRCSTVPASHAKRTVGRARAAVSEQRGTASERRGRRREKKEAKKTRCLISFSIERRARK